MAAPSNRSSELPADLLAACSGSSVRLFTRPAFTQATVSHEATVCSLAWNRNNKVVATGCADGAVQLCYSTGKLMSVLKPEGGGVAGALGSLDWSMGSKFLAAGSADGAVYIWDLKVSKACTALGKPAAAPVTSVRYHPEDKFLAVASAGGGVSLFDLQGRPLASLACAADGSSKRSLQATPAEAALACGTDRGGVVVWDWSTRQLKEHYQGQHQGAVSAVEFIPLKTSMLYSAGADGKLVLQDRRAGPAYASRTSVGAPLASLSVREDYTSVAVGTADGAVLLFDPRQLSVPTHRLDCGAPGQPVTGLHWQHCYSSLSSRMRAAAARPKVQAHSESSAADSSGAAVRPSVTPPAAAAVAAVAAGSAAAPGSRIPQAAAGVHAAPATSTAYSALRRDSSIGAGGAAAGGAGTAQPAAMQQRQPSSGAATPSGAASPSVKLNPLFARGQGPAAARGSTDSSPTAAPPAGPAYASAQPQPQLTPLAAVGYGAGEGLAVTPLSGMVPRHAAAAAGTPRHVTPVSNHHASLQQGAGQPQVGQGPLGARTATPLQQHMAAEAATPFNAYAVPAAAAMDFAVTPLSSMAARPAERPAVARDGAEGQLATPSQRQYGMGVGGLAITPLSGMRPPAPAQAALPGVLHDSTNQRSGTGAAGGLLAAEHAAPGHISTQQQQQQQASPPSLAHHLPPLALGSPLLAENLPSPQGTLSSVGSKKAAAKQQRQQQVAAEQLSNGAAMVVEDSAALPFSGAKKHTVAPAVAADGAGSGSEELWFVKAAAAGQQGDVSMVDTASKLSPVPPPQQQQQQGLPQGPQGSPAFSFHQQQPQAREGSPGAWAPQPAAAVAQEQQQPSAAAVGALGEPPGLQHGLREDILALHLDLLNQFQVQQEQMTAMMGRVLERQDALAAEVSSLRRQLHGLMQTRDEFLWL